MRKPLATAVLSVLWIGSLLVAGAARAEVESFGGALTPVPIAETAASITVITREQIERRGSPRAVDLLRTVPGVAIAESGPLGAQAQVRIRGAEGNHTLVIVDGIEVNDPSADSEFDFANLLSEHIEQIEVIRGPLAGFYGSESIGGVIYIRTREGHPGLSISGNAEAGHHHASNLSTLIQMGGERWRQSFTVQSLRTRGDSAAGFGAERDGYKNLSVHARGSLKPLEELEFDYSAQWSDTETEIDNQLFTGEVVDDDRETDPRFLYARTQARLSLFEGRLTQRAGVALTDTRRSVQRDQRLFSTIHGRRFKFDYQVSAAESVDALDVRATAQYEREEHSFRSRTLADGVFTFVDTRDSPRSETVHSAIGELRLGWDDRVFLNGSFRGDFNRRFRNSHTYRIGMSSWVPGVAGLRVRGGWGKAIVNPTFAEIFGFPGFIPPSPNLIPESSRGFDVGLDYDLPVANAHVSLSVYRTQLAREIQFAGFMMPAFNGTVSKRRGVELGAAASPFSWLDLSGSYAYALSKEKTASGYQREVRRPRHQGSLTIDVRALQNRLRAQIGATIKGRSQDFNFANFPAREPLDAFGLLHARIGFQVRPGLEFFVRAENLVNDHYEEVRDFETPGLQVFGGVKFRWAPSGSGVSAP